MARIVIIDKQTQREVNERHLVIGSDNRVYYLEEETDLTDMSDFYEIKIKEKDDKRKKMTIKQYCEVINLTDQRVKQLIKQNILKKDIDYISEVIGITPKFTFNEQAIKTYQNYKQNCRKRK